IAVSATIAAAGSSGWRANTKRSLFDYGAQQAGSSGGTLVPKVFAFQQLAFPEPSQERSARKASSGSGTGWGPPTSEVLFCSVAAGSIACHLAVCNAEGRHVVPRPDSRDRSPRTGVGDNAVRGGWSLAADSELAGEHRLQLLESAHPPGHLAEHARVHRRSGAQSPVLEARGLECFERTAPARTKGAPRSLCQRSTPAQKNSCLRHERSWHDDGDDMGGL